MKSAEEWMNEWPSGEEQEVREGPDFIRAIQADALEAAVRRCKAIESEHETYHDDAAENAFQDACDDCAESIKALLPQSQEKP